MSDLISRQAAIDEIIWNSDNGVIDAKVAIEALRKLPSVESERKPGKIICSNEEINCGNIIGHVLRCKCSECNFVIDRYEAKFINYCPNCGAKMEGGG